MLLYLLISAVTAKEPYKKNTEPECFGFFLIIICFCFYYITECSPFIKHLKERFLLLCILVV